MKFKSFKIVKICLILIDPDRDSGGPKTNGSGTLLTSTKITTYECLEDITQDLGDLDLL